MSNTIELVIFGKDKFSNTFKAFGSGLTSVARNGKRAGIAVAAAGTAVTAFVGITTKGIDASAKFSTRIGVGVDELTKMQFAAQQSGIEVSQMNMAVQRMTRRVAEAAAGTGEAKQALFELGINAKSFKGMKLEDQMALLADKMGAAGTSSDQLR